MPWAMPQGGHGFPLVEKPYLYILQCSCIWAVPSSPRVKWTQECWVNRSKSPFRNCGGEPTNRMQSFRTWADVWADSTWAPAGAPGATLPLKSHFTAALPQGQPSALGEGMLAAWKGHHPWMWVPSAWDINPAQRFSLWKSKEHFSVQHP